MKKFRQKGACVPGVSLDIPMLIMTQKEKSKILTVNYLSLSAKTNGTTNVND